LYTRNHYICSFIYLERPRGIPHGIVDNDLGDVLREVRERNNASVYAVEMRGDLFNNSSYCQSACTKLKHWADLKSMNWQAVKMIKMAYWKNLMELLW